MHMANYQQYQKYKRQPEGSGFKLGKILMILAIIVVLYLIGRVIFGGSTDEVTTTGPEINANTEVDTDANENANTNPDENENSNSNTNSNSNSNQNTNTAVAGSFDVNNCTQVYSRGVDKAQIALTFNVGTATEGKIQELLNSLKDKGVTASFFARGDVAEENPDIIKKIDNNNFPIYNLSYSHPYFTDLPESGIIEQLQNADSAITQRTNKTSKPFFRPPYGDIDADVVSVVTAEGYCPVTWTVDAMDWSTEMSASDSKERVLSGVTNGAIILMQASNSITAEIISEVVTDFQNKGYSIVSLEDLLSE